MENISNSWKELRLEFSDDYLIQKKNQKMKKLEHSCKYECGFKGNYEQMYGHHLYCKLNEKNNTSHNKKRNITPINITPINITPNNQINNNPDILIKKNTKHCVIL